MNTVKEEKGSLQVKRYLCVVCEKKAVVESRIEHLIQSDAVPESDFNTYTDHKVTGGKLLEKRPDIPWAYPLWSLVCKPPLGGICNTCMIFNYDVVHRLLPHINFAEEPK